MALIVSALQSSLLTTFLAMNDILDGSGDRYMADNVAANIKAYILTGMTSTTDTGVAPAGNYSGEGIGTMEIDESALAEDLLSTFKAEHDNDGLAAHMASDIDNACSKDGTVSETSSGMVTTSSGASQFSGSAQGKFTGDKSGIESALKSCFSAMDGMSAGGNERFAAELATAVDDYLKGGDITVSLKSPFVSGMGKGKIA